MLKPCIRTRAYLSLAYRSRLAHTISTDDKRWPGWQVVIGIEVHAQIKSRAKLFSYSHTSTYDQPHNTHVDPFDAAFPGTLPKLNSSCVELATRTALALESRVQHRSAFDRKHYFYTDLPSGYQITQHYAPIALGGSLKLEKHGKFVSIKQIQLEQDTAKSVNDYGSRLSTVDLNRAGTALMEIVSEPDMRSPEEASDYVRTLRALLRSIGSSDGNMEEGSLRCDANISVNRVGEPFGTRCEIKNLNSLKFLQVALTSEAFRQIEMIESGKSVPQETRGFDENTAETFTLRSKEDAPDYRYMPDPNLPPIMVDEGFIESIRNSMPELPEETVQRLQSAGLNGRDAHFLVGLDAGKTVGYDGKVGAGAVSYFDAVSRELDAKVAFNWITNDLYTLLVVSNLSFADNPVTVAQMREIITMVVDNDLTNAAAKALLKHIITKQSPASPRQLAQELTLLSLASDEKSLDSWCGAAMKALPKESALVRDGNPNVLNKIVGHAMKASRGRADPLAIRERLLELIQSGES